MLPIVVVAGAAVVGPLPVGLVPALMAAMVGPTAGNVPGLPVARMAAAATSAAAAAATSAAAAGACGAVSCGWPAAASAAPPRPPAAA